MRPTGILVAVLGLLLCAAPVRAEPADSLLVGGEFDYTVRRGDTLSRIAARFAVDVETLARRNGISLAKKKLVAGQRLFVDNRHVVPRTLDDGILINVPQRLLFHFEGGRLVAWYPAALGQPGSWGTPTGSFRIATREKDPTWDVPLSIQQEMRRKGERVRTKVAPGADNPLGPYWLGLSLECCGIHGTNAPDSIYTFQTHGCIRLASENAEELFSRVSVGTPVEIVYEPVLLARTPDGSTFLEVHPDVYGRRDDATAAAEAIADGRGSTSLLRARTWEETIRNEEGVAVPLDGPRFRLSEGRRIESRVRGGRRVGTGIVLSNVGPGAGEVRPRLRRPARGEARLPAGSALAVRGGDGDPPRARAGDARRDDR